MQVNTHPFHWALGSKRRKYVWEISSVPSSNYFVHRFLWLVCWRWDVVAEMAGLEAGQIDNLWKHKSNTGKSNTNFSTLRDSYLKEKLSSIVWQNQASSLYLRFNWNCTKTKLFWNFMRSRPPNKIWAWKITTKLHGILFTFLTLSNLSALWVAVISARFIAHRSKKYPEPCRVGICLALI